MSKQSPFSRAVRTSAQVLAAGLIALPVVTAVADFVSVREAFTVALYQAGLAGVVSFLQNFAEDRGEV